MKRRLSFAILLVGLLLASPAIAYDAYNNFDTGDAYDTTIGWPANMGAYTPFIPRISGSRFTATASGHLAVIRIALHNIVHTPPGTNLVDIRLHEADAAGELGPILASFTRSGVPDFGGSHPPETLVNSEDVNIVSGQRYWIVVAPGDTSTDIVWNWNSIGTGDRFAQSTNFGLTYGYSFARQGAMRIEVIPEPTTLSLLAVGIAIAMFRQRHR